MYRIRVLLVVSAFLFTSPVVAQDWSVFRGPSGDGVSEYKNLPIEWGVDKNVFWAVELPGDGWSSPVVVDDQVIVTSAVAQQPTAEKSPTLAAIDPAGHGWQGVPEL